MKPIGGYFELELAKGGNLYHDTPYVMKSGRSCLHYILKYTKPSLVYIPYYTCDALLEPFEAANIPYAFYEINERMEPATHIELNPEEYFLYVNYLDIKRDTVALLSEQYKDKLIVDCTQAFFMKGNGVSWFFNSCRKFFGVPDGAYLYPPTDIQLPVIQPKNESYITDHLLKRFNGHPDEGYSFFQQNEVLAGSEIIGMSTLSEYLLSKVNYEIVAQRRCENYYYLHENLNGINQLSVSPDDIGIPMSYPLLLDSAIDKQPLFRQKIFIPTFWKDTLQRSETGFSTEKRLTDYLLPLPIDHRYTLAEMEFMYQTLMMRIK